MAAPYGNKNAVGYGRPRTTCPSDEDLIELGEDLVKWATEPTKEWRVQYCDWYSLKQGLLEKHWKAMVQKDCFRAYYEQARSALSRKYIDGTVNPSIAHRFLRVYCPDPKSEEDETFKNQLEIKSKTELAASPLQDQIDNSHELMLLKAENEKLKALLNDNKREAE